MSTPNSNSNKPVHHLVQLSYATPLFAEQSVLLVGDNLPLAEFAAQTGANVVAVSPVPPSPPWPRFRPEEGMVHHVMPLDNLAFEEGVFGAAVIPNLSAVENPSAVLTEIRRILARNGHLIAAVPNPAMRKGGGEVMDYYKMYDMLSLVFPVVQMIGQSAFNGFAVADLSNADGVLEVSFNSELIGNEAEEISWFVAVCGNKKAVLEPYAIVQVPAAALLAAETDPAEVAKLEEELAVARRELGNRGVRIESLEKSLEEELMQSEAARERAVKLSKELDLERKAVTKKTLEDEFSKRSADMDLNGALHAAKKALRLAEQRAESAEAARDDIIDHVRSDATELEKLRRKIVDLESRPRRDPEAEKKIRLAEERANFAESARDELIGRMRTDAAELDRLRQKVEALESRPKVPARDPEAEKKARLAEERAQSAEAARDDLIDRMRADGAEMNRLRSQLDENTAKIDALKKSEAALQKEIATLKKTTAEAAAAAAAELASTQVLAARAAAPSVEVVAVPAVDVNTAKNEETAAEIAALEKENQELEKRLALMAEKKRAAEEEAQRQTVIVRDLVVKLETIATEVKEETPTVVTVSPEPGAALALEAATARVNSLETEMAALWGAKAGEHRARVEAELELTGRMVEIERLKDNLAAVNLHLRTRDEELKRMTAERDALLEKAQASKEGEKEELQGQQALRVAELESELQAAKWRIDELSARKIDFEKQLEAATSEAADLRETALRQQSHEAEKWAAAESAMQLRLSEREAENQRLNAALESTARRERMLDEEIGSLTVRSKSLRGDLDDALSRVESLSGDLRSAREEREQMIESLRQLTGELDAEKKSRFELDETVKSLSAALSEAQARMKSAEVELTGAHEKIGDLSRIAASHQDETGRFQEIVDALDRRQAEVVDLRGKLSKAAQAMAAETEKSQELRADLERLRAAVETEAERTHLAGADAARISGEAAAMQAKLERSAAAIVERDAEIETDIQVIRSLRGEVQQLSEKLRAARGDEARMSLLNMELEKVRAESEQLGRELSGKESELQEKTRALAEQELTLSGKAADLGDKISTLVEKESKLSEMESTLMEKESKLQEKESEIQEKIAALARLKEREEELLTELSERRKEIEETSDAVSEMEAKIVAVNQAKVGLSVELADAIQKAERLEVALAQLQQRESETAAESESLKAALAQANAMSREQANARDAANILADTMASLQKTLAEKEALVGSLTEQLEERERRAAKLERQNRALTEQIQEHDGDLSAWDMELKLRSARISQLEKELAETKGK